MRVSQPNTFDTPETSAKAFGDIMMPITVSDGVTIDPSTGMVTYEDPDGGVIVQVGDEEDIERGESKEFGENLVGILSEDEVKKISCDLLDGIESDLESRKGWEAQLKEAMTMLGLDVESVSSLDMATISKIRHPALLDGVLDFWSQFQGEFLPSDGPCKVRCDGIETAASMEMAERLERDFNHYLTEIATEYYPDTNRAALRIALIGGIVKKIYACPVRQRPVSESVYLEDLVVSNNATDLDNAKRITHRLMYLKQDVDAMIEAGAWADVDLGMPNGEVSDIAKKVGEIEGMSKDVTLDLDRQYTIYETLAKIKCDDPLANENLPCTYKVTIDKDSRKVLAIYRHWVEGDENFKPKRMYVMWSYCPGLGFYPMGLAQILRNPLSTLTALWREMVDGGMYSSFPGTLHSDVLGRQDTNILRVMPGESKGVKVPMGQRIQDCVMALPYKDVSATLLAFAQHIEERADKTAGKAAVPIGEGTSNIPVGTVVAHIEQSTKLMQAIHKGLHTSQKREMELLKDLFVEDPGALTRFDKDPNKSVWTSEDLENQSFVPASDPNTPSHIHRIMQGMVLGTVAQQMPGMFDPKAVASRLLKTAGIHDVESLFVRVPMGGAGAAAGGASPAADPAKLAAVQLKAQEQTRKAASEAVNLDMRKTELAARMADSKADRESKERMANQNAALEMARLKHDVNSNLNLASLKAQSEHAKLMRQNDHNLRTTAMKHDHDHRKLDKQLRSTHHLATMSAPPAQGEPNE